ncbi:MAG: PKD domain-containing protein, partial [Actinobacteria bacterium]|nr:PKD domain-containing protein [Actinomycetota bacterium]
GSLDDYTCGNRDARPACNWGDYAGATPDPTDPRLVWGSAQSIGPVTPGVAHWRTRNFALQPTVVVGASFTVSPNPAPVGQSVSFDGSASTSVDPGGTVVRYQWDLDGDGSFETDTGAAPTASRTYTTPATLSIKLRATDSRGATSATTRTLRINAPPASSFFAIPSPARPEQSVSFDASASADPDGTIVRYRWDLDGDGSFETDTGTTPTASRTYTTPARLNVKLRVTDNDGATSETTQALRINAPPAATFSATPSPARPEPSVSFDGSASVDPDGIIARYQWDLDGDGSFETDTGATPTTTRIYTMPGTLNVKLRVTDSDGATSEATGSVVVTRTSPKPVPVSRRFPGCAITAPVRLGTLANDTITGTPAGERIFTEAGDDTVSGLAGDDCIDLGAGADRGDGGVGNDLILGGAGRDRLRGGVGRDRLRGGTDGDQIFGGGSRDSLSGGPGADGISGGAGNDRIAARDGKRDGIRCGPGRDSVVADRLDRVARDCERVSRRR